MRLAFLLCAVCPTLLSAQSDTVPRTAADSAIARARVLVNEGKEIDGRRVLDSLLKVTTPDSAAYVEALYWRGALAATAVEAERDYRRLLIEAPLSPRAEDAMLHLANLLQARGDRRGASDHLQRFMLTYANSPARPRVALSLVRLLFDLGPQQQARACEALRMGREAIPRENLELRNQLEYYEPRCIAEVATAPTRVDSAVPDSSAADSAKAARDSAKKSPPDTSARKPVTPRPAPTTPAVAPSSAATAKSYYSVQVAAYQSREPARNLVSLLVERGLEARVDGTAAPYRVRVGKYGTRAEAVKAAASLKSQGHNGFITLVQQKK